MLGITAVRMLVRYLRQQGETCLRWGRETFDLTTAENLRQMGEEFIRKAEELERQESLQGISVREADEGKTDTGPALDP